jgi:hypothetical protein
MKHPSCTNKECRDGMVDNMADQSRVIDYIPCPQCSVLSARPIADSVGQVFAPSSNASQPQGPSNPNQKQVKP